MNKEFSGESVWKNRIPRGSKMRNLVKGGGGGLLRAYQMLMQ